MIRNVLGRREARRSSVYDVKPIPAGGLGTKGTVLEKWRIRTDDQIVEPVAVDVPCAGYIAANSIPELGWTIKAEAVLTIKSGKVDNGSILQHVIPPRRASRFRSDNLQTQQTL